MFKSIAVIILVILIGYYGSFSNAFVGDDHYTVVNNDFIASWNNFPHLFSAEYLARHDTFFTNSFNKKNYRSGEFTYRPIVTLSYMLDYFFWELNPFGYHATNIALHILNAILVYLVFLALLKDNLWALLGGLFFGLHPINTEAANHVSYREDLLAVFFFLAALNFFIRYKNYSGFKKGFLYGGSCVSFLLALFSKEIAITLPLVLVLYDFYFEEDTDIRRIWANVASRYLGYLIATLFFVGIYFFVFSPTLPLDIPYAGGSLSRHLLTAATILVRYAVGFFMPFTISIVPNRYSPAALSLLSANVLPSIILLLLFAVGIYPLSPRSAFTKVSARLLRSFSEGELRRDCSEVLTKENKIYPHSKHVSFGLLWFFVTILPVSGIFFPLANMFAFRYMYLPVIGLCLILVIACRKLSAVHFFRRTYPHLGKIVAAMIIGAYTTLTMFQNRFWKNEFMFSKNQIMHYPDVPESYQALIKHCYTQGLYGEAIGLLERYVQLRPDDFQGHRDLGTCYYKLGMRERAIGALHKALALNPQFTEAYFNLGTIYLAKQDFPRAIACFKRAIVLDPQFAQAYNNLGVIWLQLGDYAKAKELFSASLALMPDSATAKANLKIIEESLAQK